MKRDTRQCDLQVGDRIPGVGRVRATEGQAVWIEGRQSKLAAPATHVYLGVEREEAAKRRLCYYISGPMRGIPEYNFPAFDHAAAWLRARNIDVINPADHDREIEPDIESKAHYAAGDASLNTDGPKFEQLIRWDLEQISRDDCTGVVLLPGWENSTGAGMELDKALELGKEVWILSPSVGGENYAWVNYVPAPAAAVIAVQKVGPDGKYEPVQAHDTFTGKPVYNPAALAGQVGSFVTKDSGERATLKGGMVRDTDKGKPRYDLIPLLPLRRLAELYARGAEKYEARNWEKACDTDALERFKGSALRHLFQALEGDRTEDHLSAVVFNIFGWIWLEEKLSQPFAGSLEEAKADVRERLAHGGVQH